MKSVFARLAARFRYPPMPDLSLFKVPSDEELADYQERMIRNIVARQAEGNVLLSVGRINTRGFSLIEDDTEVAGASS